MSNYRVVYYVMGKRREDEFDTLEEAEQDFAAKKELDKELVFDDRFVSSIEDSCGNIINNRFNEKE